MTLGCVVGKFWPPHLGHVHLVERARDGCDELHVIVIERPDESPSGALRARWMRQLFPSATVHLTVDDIPDESSAWAARTRELLGRSPDVVFTSETYGDTWAAELGCRHVCVDLPRETVPVSSTAVRADPLGHWDLLPAPVRAYYAPRVVLVGAESTGKTTLASRLAARFETLWVPEWARLYGTANDFGVDDWERDERLFDLITTNQPLLENALAQQCNRLLICDTDLLTTSIWHETYRPDAAEERAAIVAAHDEQRAACDSVLYLLCLDASPWIQDGTRNRGSDDAAVVGSRPWFTRRLREELSTRGERVVELSGDWDDRFAGAVDAVEVVTGRERARLTWQPR